MRLKYVFILVFTIFILSGCNSSYDFEESEFDSNNIDSNFKSSGESNGSGSNGSSSHSEVKVGDGDFKGGLDYNFENEIMKVFSQFEVNERSIKINGVFTVQDEIDLKIFDISDNIVCSWANKVVLSNGDNEILFEDCNLKKNENYTLVIESDEEIFKFNFIPSIDVNSENNVVNIVDYDMEINDKIIIKYLYGDELYLEHNTKIDIIIDSLEIKMADVEVCNIKNIRISHYGVGTHINLKSVCGIEEGKSYEIKLITSEGIYKKNLFSKGKVQSENLLYDYGDLTLEIGSDEEINKLFLHWNKPLREEGFKYYKVVHSTTNSDLKYPDDGYITYISDINNTSYIDTENFKEGMNYYRITYVYDDEKVHSNVINFNVNYDSGEEIQYCGGYFIELDKTEYVLGDEVKVNLTCADGNHDSKNLKIYLSQYYNGSYHKTFLKEFEKLGYEDTFGFFIDMNIYDENSIILVEKEDGTTNGISLKISEENVDSKIDCYDSEGSLNPEVLGYNYGYGYIGSIYEDELVNFTDSCWVVGDENKGLTEYQCNADGRIFWQSASCEYWTGNSNSYCDGGICLTN